ncbi:hypothetical protein L249_7311 [Ophiocordyceps polyrhachis-furcata BCC 54312]|uniref:RIC1 C-terminal alpha solenoid region domain-containing protein n=1 Tax=Ophiocordyceps polyrhachis-furcata BCC 54312 TaxID=1330021 RepID=A0A367LA02_9HYPO|nr:hypothetical protein L249_7311 [Ophiocordyceps polyrhachis-furcata BCC 54312]
MYWPIGTPRIYATSSRPSLDSTLVVSHDGFPSPYLPDDAPSTDVLDDPDPLPPPTPMTPAVQPVEHDDNLLNGALSGCEAHGVPLKDPVLALRPTVILAVVVRSDTSLQSYGKNVDVLLRPDSAILVVRTDKGYLITYSIATDGESSVYKPYFPNYHNVQRRKQKLIGSQAGLRADHFLWGAGEGSGVRDVSVRFRMVIKVDAGIESALALDDEIVVSTSKPAAVQCIRWTPDSSGSQTRTEIVSRMSWVEKRSTVVEMTYDRPMNLATWITSDGRAYAVQRRQHRADDADPKSLFSGHCFHTPQGSEGHALKAAINARFSLIAVGCSDGTVHVYSVKDYAGNITHSHTRSLPVSAAAAKAFTSLGYSPDGYCLFAGCERGWTMWSMFGKLGSHSFGADDMGNGEQWLSGVTGASWIGGGSEILLIGRGHEAVWSLEMAKSAVTGCYNEANVFRSVLQTPSAVMIYRGYDLPDLTSISAEPFLWHTAALPPTYLLNQWPIRQTVISPDGRYVAVAGRRGLAHYSVNSGRWKTFTAEASENEFQVRGGMCWYQHILVAAVESHGTYQVRLFSRETALEPPQVLFTQQMPAPVVLVATSGEDSLLVYTYENLLYHFIFTPWAEAVRLVQVGQIAFHGIVRSPARVRGLSWILPEKQLVDGDPSQDVAVASVVFLVDGKLVLLSPSVNEDGQLKYDMRVVAQNVEYHASMRDQSLLCADRPFEGSSPLRDSMWVFDGVEIKAWTNARELLEAAASGDGSKNLPVPVAIPVDFYPLSILLNKGIVLGVESDLVQRRHVIFSFFRFAIRTHLFLSDVLRFFLRRNRTMEAGALAERYGKLEYVSHGLEMLLHRVLDEEAESCPRPEDAVLPRVLSLLSSSKDYLDIVLRCTRKTEVRQWKTLFAYLPPAQELFEESLQRGSLKTAGGYLIILHTLEELGSSTEQPARVLSRAMQEGDWELCKELARFLAATDETGATLRETMSLVNAALPGREADGDMRSRLAIPASKTNGRARDDARSTSEASSILRYAPDVVPGAAQFISSRGNEYFCEIDEDYLTDRFNLTGLQTEVSYYQYALDLITDVFDLDCDDEMRETIEKAARHLYGLVHARYIVTTRGLTKMLDKYKKAEFGKCPRVNCHSHPLLPTGTTDNPNCKPVKLYCARCEDLYNPKSSRHAAIDGAYFGTSFHNILFQVYPALVPSKVVDRYVPRIYGFKVHASAALIRWQNKQRDSMRIRLRRLEIDSGFKEEMPIEDDEVDDAFD